jgi:MFS family permease
VLTAATIYGIGLCPGVFPKHWHWVFLGLVFVVAVAAGVVMTLAWTLLYEVMPEGDRGASAGLASATKGAGLLIGPALAGGSIDLCRGLLPATDGYAVMWPVLAVPVLATLPLVLLLRRRR